MKRAILFVDDEPDILRGLQRASRRFREEFDFHFAEGGQAALATLENTPIDAVVSDMRMPGIDGATLLEKVSIRWPGALRFILSGFSAEEAVLRTVGPAHQFLSKPCNIDTVISALQRSLKLREHIHNDAVTSLISGFQNLPTPSRAFRELLQKLDDPKTTLDKVTGHLEHDIGLSAQILKLTNSAYFSLPTHVSTVERAVHLLGIETIKALAMVSGFFSIFKGNHIQEKQIENLSSKSILIGNLAYEIARNDGYEKAQADQARCAGFLAHTGSLALICGYPNDFARAITAVEREKIPISAAEKRVFKATHGEIGGYLLSLWGFADPIIEAVCYHHHPSGLPAHPKHPLTAVHAAQYLAWATEDELTTDTQFDHKHIGELNLSDKIEGWKFLARKLAKEVRP